MSDEPQTPDPQPEPVPQPEPAPEPEGADDLQVVTTPELGVVQNDQPPEDGGGELTGTGTVDPDKTNDGGIDLEGIGDDLPDVVPFGEQQTEEQNA